MGGGTVDKYPSSLAPVENSGRCVLLCLSVRQQHRARCGDSLMNTPPPNTRPSLPCSPAHFSCAHLPDGCILDFPAPTGFGVRFRVV